MNTEEILTLAAQVVSAWDWTSTAVRTRPNQLDVKITSLAELRPGCGRVCVSSGWVICQPLLVLILALKRTKWKCFTTSARGMR